MAKEIKKADFDRIEVTKKCGIPMLDGLPNERILERAIHNPDMADIGDIFRRLHAANILEIKESQEFAPICSGPGYVEDYVPIKNKEIRFVIIEKK